MLNIVEWKWPPVYCLHFYFMILHQHVQTLHGCDDNFFTKHHATCVKTRSFASVKYATHYQDMKIHHKHITWIPHMHVPAISLDTSLQFHQYLLHALTSFLPGLSSVFLCFYKHDSRLEEKWTQVNDRWVHQHWWQIHSDWCMLSWPETSDTP